MKMELMMGLDLVVALVTRVGNNGLGIDIVRIGVKGR